MRIIKITLAALCLLLVNLTYAQLQVNTGMTPQQLVQNILVGGGITVTNVTFVGQLPDQLGSFLTGGNPTNLGINSGIMLSSGNVTDAPGPNSSGSTGSNTSSGSDPDLQSIAGMNVNDKAVLEFNFIPLSDTVKFMYVFASEEYPEFVNSGYNDAFGFFLSGPGITGPYSNNSVNIALIPGTSTPVTIDNVNDNTNSQYYVDNTGGATIEYDGFTVKITAWRVVTPCQQYHIKIAVADAGDSSYDSAVFLEAGSFISSGITAQTSYTGPDSASAVRSCNSSSATVTFNIPQAVSTPTVIHYTIGGTAVNGVDYVLIPDSVIIPANMTSANVVISPLPSTGNAPIETVTLTASLSPCQSSTITVNIRDYQNLSVTMSNPVSFCSGLSTTLSVTPANGLPPYTYLWSTSQTSSSITVAPADTTTYYVTVSDVCTSVTDSVLITINPNPLASFSIPSVCGTVIGQDPPNTTTINNTSQAAANATYSWTFSGPVHPSGTSSLQNPTPLYWDDDTDTMIYNITLIVTNPTGCSDTLTAQAQVLPSTSLYCCVPPETEAGLNDTIFGLTYTLNATVSPSSSGNWTLSSGPGTAVFSPNSTVANATVTVTNTGQYWFHWTEQSGPNCFGDDSVLITFVCAPLPTDAGENDSICGLTYQLNGSVTPGTTGSWSLLSGPGTSSFVPDDSLAGAFVTVSTSGQYWFQWTEQSNAVCFQSDSVLITFIQIPDADAGTDQTDICGVSTQLAAIPSVGSGHWSEVNGDSLHPTIFIQDFVFNATALVDSVYGTHEFMWLEDNYGCRDTDYVEIIYHEQPQADAGTDIVACGNTTNLNGSANTGPFSGFWTASTNGVFYDPGDTASYVNVVVPPYQNAYTESFWWHQVNEMCRDSDQVDVYFQPFAGQTMVSAGFDIITCDTFAQLHGIVQPSGFGTGHWTTFNNVIIDSSLDANTFIRFQPNDSTYECDSSKYVVTMTWTVTNGVSCTAVDYVKITFFQTPESNAGFEEDQHNEATCIKQIRLGAKPSICKTYGSWSLASAPSGCTSPNFSDIHGPGSSVQVGCYGIYEFVWFEQNMYNTQCASHDTVTIEFVEPPNIYAGADQYVCGRIVYLDATPSGSSVWQSWSTAPVNWLDTNLLNDPSQITNPDAIADHFHVENDSIIFVWGERNESTIPLGEGTLQCPSTDSVTVYFFTDQAANELINFADTFQCGNIFPNLVAAPPQEGYGIWADTTFANTVFSQNTYPDNLHDSATVSDYGMHHFFWITKNGERPDGSSVCLDTSDVVPIRFIEYPDAEILAPLWAANPVPGSDIKWDTVCGPEYLLNPDTNSPGSYMWFTYNEENISFTSNGQTTTTELFDTVLTEIYNSDIGIPSYYEVYLSIDNSVLPAPVYSHGCIDRDTVRITFARRPSGEILLDTTKWPKCYGGIVPLSAANDQPGKPISFEWGFGGGNLDTTYINTTTPDNLNDSIYEVSWDTTGGDMAHVVSLRTRNPWKCSSVTDTIVVSEPRPYYPEDSVYHATCHQSNGRIKLFIPDSCASCGYYWNDTIYGNQTLLERGYLDPKDCYDIKLYYISKKDNQHTCNHFFCVPVRDTGQVYAAFSSMITDTVHLTPGNEVVFENQSEGGKTYSWHFGDGGTSTSENPSYVFEKGGSFYVYLIARSKEGCESVSDSIRYEIEKSSELEVPNIFTPNGDGKNDIFQVSGKTLKSFHGIISNRWGKTLYEWDEWRKESGGTKYGWDGKIGSTEAAPGVYYYMIKADGWDDIQYNLKGAFHLEREK